ncbi:hypothetical protein KM043_003745 [Ampulex compressa]|nr:hypothetical protein KM043_003745 [Ampulex compressa]
MRRKGSSVCGKNDPARRSEFLPSDHEVTLRDSLSLQPPRDTAYPNGPNQPVSRLINRGTGGRGMPRERKKSWWFDGRWKERGKRTIRSWRKAIKNRGQDQRRGLQKVEAGTGPRVAVFQRAARYGSRRVALVGGSLTSFAPIGRVGQEHEDLRGRRM